MVPGERIVGLLLPLTYILVETGMYYVFRRWRSRVDSLLEREIDTITLADGYKKERDDPVAILKFSDDRKKAIWVFALFLMGFFFVLEVIGAIFAPFEPRETYLERIGTLTALLCLCGLVGPYILFIEPYGNIRVVTLNGILKRSPWTGTSFIRWDEMKSVRWVPILDNFFVTSMKGLFAVSPVYENLDKFADGVMKNLPRAKWIHAEEMLDRASRGPFQP